MKQCTQTRRTSKRPSPFGLAGILVALVAGMVLSVAVSAQDEHESAPYADDPQWLLTVTQDESSMEEAITEYLTERTDWLVEGFYLDPEETDLILNIEFEFDEAPTINIMVDTLISNGDDEEVVATAQSIYEQLRGLGIEVVLDDRDLRPGAKFNDADLVGFPYQVVVGKRGIKEGKVEIKARSTGEKTSVLPAEAAAHVAALIRDARTGR